VTCSINKVGAKGSSRQALFSSVSTVFTPGTLAAAGSETFLPNDGQDRHRGGGHPPTPATPPCVRVRTRRFELVTLASIDQRWQGNSSF
jgi:hypothetical protein